jgi:hypothetical protein
MAGWWGGGVGAGWELSALEAPDPPGVLFVGTGRGRGESHRWAGNRRHDWLGGSTRSLTGPERGHFLAGAPLAQGSCEDLGRLGYGDTVHW